MKELVEENLRVNLILLLPTALGDSIMTMQAIRVYLNFLKYFRIKCVGMESFISIYQLICKEVEHISYEDLYKNPKQNITGKHLLDFRSDEEMQVLPIEVDYIFKFEFEPTRRVKIISKKTDALFFEIEEIQKLFLQIGHEFVAWKMDGELISAFIDFTFTQKRINCIKEIQNLPPTLIGYNKKRIFTLSEILIFPCGSQSQKHWPIIHWQQLIGVLSQRNIKISIFLGPNEEHYASIFEKMAPVFKNLKWEDIIKNHHSESLVVCNDCGPMHVFGTLGYPIIAIFGPTDDKVWFNYHANGFALTSENHLWPSTSVVENKIFSN
jgi:ADP-heptose:LPS heptosyltransferase